MVHCTPPENQIYSYSATSRSRIFRAPQCVHMAMALFRPAASLRPAEHGQLAEERLACGALDLALGIEQLLTPRALRRASGVILFERLAAGRPSRAEPFSASRELVGLDPERALMFSIDLRCISALVLTSDT